MFVLSESQKKESRVNVVCSLIGLDAAAPAKNGPAPAPEQPRGGANGFSLRLSEGNLKLLRQLHHLRQSS